MNPSKTISALAAASLLAYAATNTNAQEHRTTPSNVVWTVPSKDAAGSMPLGNGELGINLWVEENGDLLFYLSRNDSYSEVSQLCKVGKVRVSLSPNPFTKGTPFRQEWKLSDGVCEITAGAPKAQVRLIVFVDSAHPVVHVIGQSLVPTTITAMVESWRTEKSKPHSSWTLMGNPKEFWQAADVFPAAQPDSVSWYHRNETSPAFESTIKLQSLESIRGTLRDPILNRTFGGWITGSGFKSTDDRTLVSGAVKSFSLRVASPSSQTANAKGWLKSAEDLAKKSSDAAAALSRTAASWRSFWDRSWVICEKGLNKMDVFPTNDLPLRVGINAHGSEKFQGSIGAASVLGKPISEKEVAALSAQPPKVDPTPNLQAPEFKEGLTLEAWIKPDAEHNGRIFDKGTPGSNDGFLFDTFPGNSLRLMVGSKSLGSSGKVLKVGEWQHVAATFDLESGAMEIFLDGKSIAKEGAKAIYPEREPVNVGRVHTHQRYMQACAGRGGDFPIKFNGSIFTVEPTMMEKKEDPDFRRWGDCNWWQNIRMPYHAMQAAGDFDLMMPFFNLFESYRVFGEARTKLYFKAEGCFFAENITPWGTYANGDYGWDRTGKEISKVSSVWVRYVWNQGLEVVALMLDYYEHTGDKVFLEKRLLPMATSVLKYFDIFCPV